MSINFEIVVLVMFGFVVACFCVLLKLYDIAKGMKTTIETIRTSVNENCCDLSDINTNINKIRINLDHMDSVVTYILDEDNEETEVSDNACEDDVFKDTDSPIQLDEDPIHLITPNQYYFESGYEKYSLEYNNNTEILYIPFGEYQDVVIDNIDECIGEALKYFGVNSKMIDTVFVRNHVFKADFEIKKVYGHDE